jgi:hypothetical protein
MPFKPTKADRVVFCHPHPGFWVAVIALFLFALPAQASTCQQWQDHTICFVQIKRSAKYSWEYRAQVTIDGVKQPPTVYNCRTRQATPKNGKPQPFTEDGAGALICQLVNR